MPELETDLLRMAAIMPGLRDVDVLGVEEDDDALVIELMPTCPLPQCPQCGKTVVVVGAETRQVAGQSAFGRPAVLLWRLRRFGCESPRCTVSEWTEEIPVSAGDDALKQ